MVPTYTATLVLPAKIRVKYGFESGWRGGGNLLGTTKVLGTIKVEGHCQATLNPI